MKAQKYVHSKTIQALLDNFRKQNPSLNISYGLYLKCKPFYVSPATQREMEGCMCIKCLNP